jgi:hypothetical protein
MNMKDKRKDPEYREMERKRDRERRRLARFSNNDFNFLIGTLVCFTID